MSRFYQGFKKITPLLRRAVPAWAAILIGGLVVVGDARAVQQTGLNLPDVPLFVSLNAVPNVFLEMDDSGSMDWTVLTPWHFTACQYDARLGCGAIATSGLLYDYTGEGKSFANFEYVFSAADDAYSTGCASGRNVFELCTNRADDDFDWRAKSADLNVLYYNPLTTYKPWPGYPVASFFGAHSYPDPTLKGYADSRNLTGFVYHFWIDDYGFTGKRPDHVNRVPGPNGIIDQWDSHVKVTVIGTGASCEWVTYAPDATGIHQSIIPLVATDVRCQAALGNTKTSSGLQANIANWYQYYRRRTMVARASIATVVSELSGFRYGFGMINDQNLFVEMPASDVTNFATHNANLVKSYLQYQQQAYGTPLRRGLERVGEYYAGNLSGKPTPIVEACQKNFSVLFSDGFWNGRDPYGVNSDVDKDAAIISGRDVTLADVARYYYLKDLSPFADIVPTDPFDTANYQHMVTFTIGFGVSGDLRDTDGDGWPNPLLASNQKWYLQSSGDNERRVDDLWHAAWNSKGKYISAKRPEELISGVRAALNNISDRNGSAASGAANGGSISNESKIFQTKFDASDWHGELLALKVDGLSGQLGDVAWEAGKLLDSRLPAGRKIYTINEAGIGATFSWTGISDTQKVLLDTNPQTGSLDAAGLDRLLYIRGSREREGYNSGDFRVRSSRLGDLAHSNPEFVGAPRFFYAFDNYMSFANSHQSRQGAVYVGSNDGMLHAFSEQTGAELFAYIPGYLVGKLPELTDQLYQHEFYVDGSPTYGDAYINGSWKSLLVGALRSGGQAIYALDITRPAEFSARDVLWEFSDIDDTDMGYVFGQPQIKKMQNGQWAVIFTSGYNNTEADQNVSVTGGAYVFILFIEAGINGWGAADYVKIPVPGADGLAEPAVTDVDADSKADFIYVGDLAGQLWKIDVTSSKPGNWGVAFNGNPLFVATAPSGEVQSITTRPAVKRHPLGIQNGVLVLFGTGRYLELHDDATVGVPIQSVYSIWDRDGYYNARNLPATRNSFGAFGFDRATQLINPVMKVDALSGTRVIDPTAAGAPVWFDVDGKPKDRGWVIDLPVEGERVVREIILRDDMAFLVTLIPAGDVCSAGGTGWFMAINSTSGSAMWFPVFDIDGDFSVTMADTVSSETQGGDAVIPLGVESLSIPNLPAFLFDDRPIDLSGNPLAVFPPTANSARGCSSTAARSYSYTTQANGSITMITTAAQPLQCGRQSWRQIR